MTITFLGKDFEFDDSIQQLSLYLEQFYNYRTKLLNALSDEEKKENSQFYDNILKEPVSNIIKDLLKQLERHEIYNVTMQDFLDEDEQDPDIRQHYAEFHKRIGEILSYSYAERNAALSRARERADSNITGMGFTPVCTNLIGALTYSAMGTSTVKKQAREAERQYQHEANTLREICERHIVSQSNEEIKTYFNIFRQDIDRFIKRILEKYFTILDENHIFPIEKASYYDQQKSINILGNLAVMENKVRVLQEAFAYDPFNIRIYDNLLAYDMFDQNVMETAKTLHIDDRVSEVLEIDCLLKICKRFPEEQLSDKIQILANQYSCTVDEILRVLRSTAARMMGATVETNDVVSTKKTPQSQDEPVQTSKSQIQNDILLLPFPYISCFFFGLSLSLMVIASFIGGLSGLFISEAWVFWFLLLLTGVAFCVNYQPYRMRYLQCVKAKKEDPSLLILLTPTHKEVCKCFSASAICAIVFVMLVAIF